MLKQLRRATFDRGVLGGSGPWLILGAVLWTLRALRMATQRDTGVLWRGTIADGETLVVAARTARQRTSSPS
jgi:hypothetical protein